VTKFATPRTDAGLDTGYCGAWDRSNESQRKAATERGYPPGQPRDPGAPFIVSEKFGRYETIQAVLGATTTFTELGRFSGTPDQVDVWASAANLDVRFKDTATPEESAVKTIANDWVRNVNARRIVEARDPAGAGGQTVSVLGKWAESSGEH
jgi:hypothetical protein